jgi:hypothetical protein
MTLPPKIQLYLADDIAPLIEASMSKTGNNPSAEIRDRIRRSYEAEGIIRDLLDTLASWSIVAPATKRAKEYLS